MESEPHTDHPVSTYEAIHRMRRVLALIEVFRVADIKADQVQMMDTRRWQLAAICAGITSPDNPKAPSDTTTEMVVATMREYELLPCRKINATKARQILGEINISKPKRKNSKKAK